MGGLTSPKGGDTKTTTAVQTVPDYVSAAQKNLYGSGQTVLGGLLGSQPNYTTAGLNPDQTGAYDLVRSLAKGSFANKAPNFNINPIMPGTYNAVGTGGPSTYAATGMGDGARYAATGMGDAAQYAATGTGGPALIKGGDIQALIDPYVQSVIDPALANMRRQSDISSAQIGAQSAAAGAFGGSREALRQGQNTRALGEQTAQLVPQLMSQAYGQAAQLAGQNAQMRNTDAQFNAGVLNQAASTNAAARNAASQFNAGALNTAGQFNAGQDAAARQFNAGVLNTAAQYGAQARNADNQFNAGAVNNAGQFNAANTQSAANSNNALGIQAAQIQDALASSDQTRKMQAIQMLLGIGNQQRDIVQSNLNTPLQYLQLLAQLTPQNTGGTTTTTAPNTAQSPLQTLLGIGASLGGAALRGGL